MRWSLYSGKRGRCPAKCDPITAVVAGSAILGGGLSYAGQKKSANATKAASAANEKQAAAQAQRAETDFNKANQKAPDIAAMFARNREAGAQGMGATFLTGAGGAAPGAAQLGKSTLLGA